MNERDKLIERLIKEKKGSREDYLTLLDSIAYHESARTNDPKIKQIGGGPGRGKYQFEVGENAGGITAAKRTKAYYKEQGLPVPQWLNNASQGNDLDVTNLSSEQQDILFLGNMRKHPKANFTNVWEGKESIADFWANYHWAGPKKEKAKKLKSFNESFKNTPKKRDSIKPVENNLKPVPVTQEFKPAPNFNEFVSNRLAMGGNVGTYNNDKELNNFDTGGTHEQNPNGGVLQGVGANGQPNTVEEGETSFELKGGKYIFSHRLKID